MKQPKPIRRIEMGDEEYRGNTPSADNTGSAPGQDGAPPGEGENAEGEILETPGSEPGPGADEFEEIEVEGEKVRVKKATSEKLQKRFSNLTARTRKAEEEAAYYRGLAEGRTRGEGGGEPPTPKVKSGPPSPPDPSDYEHGIYDPRYIDDHDQYILDAAEFRSEEKRKVNRERERASEVHDKFMLRMKEAEKDDPSVGDMFKDPTFFPHNRPEAGSIISVIKESEVAPQILSHLYSNRDELDSLYRMSPLAAAREIGRLESKFMATPKTPTKKVSQAPKPVSTVGGGGNSAVIEDEDKMSTDDFMRKRNKAQYGKEGPAKAV